MRKFLVLLLLMALFTAASAQEEDAPSAFMRAMATVPLDPLVTDQPVMVSYADFHAGIEARGFDIPADWAAFTDEEPFSPLALPSAGPVNLLQYLMVGAPEYPALVGFDFFDVAQAVEIGQPPAVGQILLGAFDAAAVEAAYTARGYAVEADETGTLLCPEAGCDSGTLIDIANRNPANPFGGHLGRSELLFVGDGVLLNSANEQLVRKMAGTYSGDADSFASLPDVQAIDAALAQYPYVSAVMLVSPAVLGLSDPAALLGERATEETIEAFLASLGGDTLPPYTMVALAATADENGEYGLAMITYPDADAAATAVSVIDARLAELTSIAAQRPYAEIYGDAGTLEPAQITTDEATGVSVVTVRIASETPAVEDENGRFVQSGRAFSRFMQGLYRRDLVWLAWDVPQADGE